MLCASCGGYPRILDRMVTRKSDGSRKPPRTSVVAGCDSDISAKPHSSFKPGQNYSQELDDERRIRGLPLIVTEKISSCRSNPSEPHMISANEKSHADIARAYSSRPRASMAFTCGRRANLMLPSQQILFIADESNRSRQSISIPPPTGMACYGDLNTSRQAKQ